MVTVLQPEAAFWDEFVCQHPRSHFLQLSAWGAFKAEFGWDFERIALADANGKLVAGAQLLFRRLPFRLGAMAYVPYGPLVDWQDAEQVQALVHAMDGVARRHGSVFMKIEPGLDVPEAALQKAGFRLSPQTVQPPRTLVLDINGTDNAGNSINEDAILKQMNQGTRRNIRKSEKNGVTVRMGSRQDIDQFNRMLNTTSQRQNFGVHVPRYYERIYDEFIAGKTPVKAALLMASYVDETSQQPHDLAGVIVFVLGKQSWYLYGASSDEDRQRMASFGVQWAAIQWARAQGASIYDMVGVPDFPPDILEAQFEQHADGLWGVYRFKRGWGGRVIRTIGAWDRIYGLPIYWAYRAYLGWRKNSGEH